MSIAQTELVFHEYQLEKYLRTQNIIIMSSTLSEMGKRLAMIWLFG